MATFSKIHTLAKSVTCNINRQEIGVLIYLIISGKNTLLETQCVSIDQRVIFTLVKLHIPWIFDCLY